MVCISGASSVIFGGHSRHVCIWPTWIVIPTTVTPLPTPPITPVFSLTCNPSKSSSTTPQPLYPPFTSIDFNFGATTAPLQDMHSHFIYHPSPPPSMGNPTPAFTPLHDFIVNGGKADNTGQCTSPSLQQIPLPGDISVDLLSRVPQVPSEVRVVTLADGPNILHKTKRPMVPLSSLTTIHKQSKKPRLSPNFRAVGSSVELPYFSSVESEVASHSVDLIADQLPNVSRPLVLSPIGVPSQDPISDEKDGADIQAALTLASLCWHTHLYYTHFLYIYIYIYVFLLFPLSFFLSLLLSGVSHLSFATQSSPFREPCLLLS